MPESRARNNNNTSERNDELQINNKFHYYKINVEKG